ncbi:MAG: hypothetical protein ACHQ4H_06370 [Ktedonobacterales bacterium]
METALIVVGLLLQWALIPRGLSGDGGHRYEELTQLLLHGDLSGGKYSLVGPLFSTPLYLLGEIYRSPQWWLANYNILFFTLGLLAIYLLLKDQVDRGLLRQFLLLLVAGAFFTPNLSNFYGEVFTVMCVGVGVLAVAFRRSWLGWIPIVLGVANTPATIVGLGFVVLKQVWAHRRLRYVLVLVATAALVLGENLVRRGNPLNSGYESGFTYPILFGVLSILFSFGKGLVFFAPGLLLPIRRRLLATQRPADRKLYAAYSLWIAYVAGMVLVYAHWWAWFGGWYWGPRFFLIATLPASLAIAVRLRDRRASLVANLATLAALVLSIYGAAASATFGLQGLALCTHGYNYLIPLCNYTPQYSTLWRVFAVPLPVGKKDLLFFAYGLVALLYLATPTLRDVATQVRGLVVGMLTAHGGLRAWRV